MNTTPARLFVSVRDQLVWIKISGRADFNSSIDFKTLVSQLREKGFHHFRIDLAECASMDSTFLGVLAGFGVKMNGNGQPAPDRAIELLNTNQRISELLENLGVLPLFKLATGQLPPEAPAEESERTPHSKEEVKRTCLEAHTTLMEIFPANIPKFKEVAQFLAEDVKALKNSS